MSIGYRSILRLQRQSNAIAVAEAQLQAWLAKKYRRSADTFDPQIWDQAGVHKLETGAELRFTRDDREVDNSRRRLYRLIDSTPAGTYTVSIYAASIPQSKNYPETIVVEVDKANEKLESAPLKIDPPGIVGMLLDSLQVYDGNTRLFGHPTVIRHGDTTQVVEAILDPERTASVIVAGSLGPEQDEAWRQVFADLTRLSVGTAATFVVYADAIDELNAALPPDLCIDTGKVRTFLPGVDVDDPTDAHRHKWLGPATLERSLDSKRLKVARPLQLRHALASRRRLVEMELPPDVRRTIELLRRAETGVARDARVAERILENTAAAEQVRAHPLPDPDIDKTPLPAGERHSSWDAAGSLIRRWLPIQSPDATHLKDLERFIELHVAEASVAKEQLTEAAEREEGLAEEVRALKQRLEDMELDLAQAEQDEAESQYELRVLRKRLSATSRAEDTYVAPEVDDWASPESIEELIQRLTPGRGQHSALSLVEFTGNADAALQIDERYPSGLYARTLWTFVRVLYDYAEAAIDGGPGSVYLYLNDTEIEGTKCPLERHAAKESDTVMNNTSWRNERLLPVPKSVSADGQILMPAHFKPTHRDTFAPRMHYFDDTKQSGKIYIGYIGRHLTNKKT